MKCSKLSLCVSTAIAAACVLVACVQNPATGKKEFAPFMPSTGQQVSLGLKAAPEFERQSGGRITNPVVQNYVNSVGQRIINVVPPNERRDFRFSFTVVNDKIINAFALPGGPIYITRGLLYKLETEADLAFVLGHEVGHVVAQHSARQMSKQTEMQLLISGAGMFAGDSQGGQTAVELGKFAGGMYLLKYGRDEESQADTLGLKYIVSAGYDPQASITVMKVLQSATSGSGKGNDWFATHPNPGNRLESLNNQIRRNYPQTINNPKFVTNREAFSQNVLRQRAEVDGPVRQFEELLVSIHAD